MTEIKQALEAIDYWITDGDRFVVKGDITKAEKNLCENLETIRKALEFYEKHQWRDIESAPKDGTRILALIKSGTGKPVLRIIWLAEKHGKKQWVYKLDQGFRVTPIAWQPLPDADDREINELLGGE